MNFCMKDRGLTYDDWIIVLTELRDRFGLINHFETWVDEEIVITDHNGELHSFIYYPRTRELFNLRTDELVLEIEGSVDPSQAIRNFFIRYFQPPIMSSEMRAFINEMHTELNRQGLTYDPYLVNRDDPRFVSMMVYNPRETDYWLILSYCNGIYQISAAGDSEIYPKTHHDVVATGLDTPHLVFAAVNYLF